MTSYIYYARLTIPFSSIEFIQANIDLENVHKNKLCRLHVTASNE